MSSAMPDPPSFDHVCDWPILFKSREAAWVHDPSVDGFDIRQQYASQAGPGISIGMFPADLAAAATGRAGVLGGGLPTGHGATNAWMIESMSIGDGSSGGSRGD